MAMQTPKLKLDNQSIPSLRKILRKKWIYSGMAVVVVLGAGAAFVVPRIMGATLIPANDVYSVGTGNVVQTVSTSGTIAVAQEIGLNFTGATGAVQSVSVKMGQIVKAGQVLAQLQNPLVKAEVAQAQANLLAARAKLTETDAGSAPPMQIAQDKLNVQRAQQTLAAAEQSYNDQVAQFNDRSAAYQVVVNAQVTLQKDQANAANSTVVASAQASLQAAQGQLANAQATFTQVQNQYGTVSGTQVAAAYQTELYEQNASTNWQVANTSTPNPGPNPYTASLVAAQNQYNQLNTAYQVLTQAANAVTEAQNQVTQNTLAVTNAQNQVAQLRNQIQVDEQNLQYAQVAYDDRTSAQTQVDNAKNAVVADKLALMSAQTTAQADAAPPTSSTILAAEAAVASAEAALQSAQTAYNGTILTAPINGMVTQVNIQPGAVPGSGNSGNSNGSSSAAIVIDDANVNDLQLQLQVSESQIGSIHPGESVQYTVPAYPNKAYLGTIVTVYPSPQVVSNVTEYTVIASIDNSSGDLRTGMTANAFVQTAAHNNVITIPAVALQQLGTVDGVYVYGTPSTTHAGSSTGVLESATSYGTGRRTTTSSALAGLASRLKLPKGVYFQPVQTGIVSTNAVEITHGLTVGERILLALPGQTLTTPTASQSSSFRLGGLGGGGTGVGRGGSRG